MHLNARMIKRLFVWKQAIKGSTRTSNKRMCTCIYSRSINLPYIARVIATACSIAVDGDRLEADTYVYAEI